MTKWFLSPWQMHEAPRMRPDAPQPAPALDKAEHLVWRLRIAARTAKRNTPAGFDQYEQLLTDAADYIERKAS